MNGISCDRCQAGLLLHDDVRYEVLIAVKAAYDPMDLTTEDLERDYRRELDKLSKQLEKTPAQEAQDQVYRTFRFDLCPACQRTYLSHPLNGGAERDSRPS